MKNRKIIAELIDIANELDAKDYPIFANNLTKIAEMFTGEDFDPMGFNSQPEQIDIDPDEELYGNEEENPYESYEEWLEELGELINSSNISPEDIDHIKEMELEHQYNNGISPYEVLIPYLKEPADTDNSYENETPFGIELDGGNDMDY